MSHDRQPSRKNQRRESFSGNYAKNKHIFDICVHTYQEIRSMSLVSASDYSKQKSGGDFCSGRPTRQDFCADMDIACRHVVRRMNVPWEKFQLAYLIPFDLADAQEIYVEHIFKDRIRRATLEGRCGLEFISRWGGGPKSYFQYSRRAIGERCSPTSQLISCEPEGATDGESESLPQSDNPEIMALIESAFEYEKSQGGAPVSESECGAHETI